MSADEHFSDGSDLQLAEATRVESPIVVLRSRESPPFAAIFARSQFREQKLAFPLHLR